MPETDATNEQAGAEAPWEALSEVIDVRRGGPLVAFFKELPPQDTAYAISRLGPEHRHRMFTLLARTDPDLGADLLEHFDDGHAADMIEALAPEIAAKLVDEMDSDEQADVLGEIEEGAAEAILERMDPGEAEDVRGRLDYEANTAGGLMITEYLAYPVDRDVSEVRRDLRRHAEAYNAYEIRYLYGIDGAGRLVGVSPMRALVMAAAGRPLGETLHPDPITVDVGTPIETLEDLFERVDFMALPVVDEADRLVGVVRRAAVEEAIGQIARENLAKFGGIIGGEELRSMGTLARAARRLAFLLPSVLLSTLAVAIILFFEPVIERITLLAVFLPLVANLSGAAGNQSVAVSIRELALDLVRPADWRYVGGKEMPVGLVNGAVIGLVLGAVTIGFGWISQWVTGEGGAPGQPGPLALAGVVALAYTLSSVISVFIGGILPLALKAMKVDPAMLSSPLLTTLSDMSSFLLTLTFALLLLLMLG